MIQVLFFASDAPWELTEDEFLEQVDRWAAEGFSEAPRGRVSVQGVDELDRMTWRAYYPSASELVGLAREIREGRAAMRPRARTTRAF